MTVGKKAIKFLTAMGKHKLCKACKFFLTCFKEAAKKFWGVWWGVYHEEYKLANDIGLARLCDIYAATCAKNGWSKNWQRSFSLQSRTHITFVLPLLRLLRWLMLADCLCWRRTFASQRSVCLGRHCWALNLFWARYQRLWLGWQICASWDGGKGSRRPHGGKVFSMCHAFIEIDLWHWMHLTKLLLCHQACIGAIA